MKALSIYSEARKKAGHSFSAAVEIELAHLAVVFYLNFGMEEKALPWILENYNRKIEGYRLDILYFSKLLFLVVHSDLGNDDIVSRAIRSTRKAMTKGDRLTPFVNQVLEFFTGLTKAPTSERIGVYQQFASAIEENSTEPLWQQMAHYFHFQAWAESRIGGVVMYDILKQYF